MTFLINACKTVSTRNKFGIYDPPPSAPGSAFIVEDNSFPWVAVVQNDYQELHEFYAIDHCVIFPPRADGKDRKRCDGLLIAANKIAFMELKEVEILGSEWVKNAVKQLSSSIEYFQTIVDDSTYELRRAYVCNAAQPRVRTGQAERIQRFADETGGYTLFIKQRINLDNPSG